MSELDRISAALDSLPPRTLRAFILVRYDKLSYAEAAKRLKIRPWRVERFVRRAFEEYQRVIHE